MDNSRPGDKIENFPLIFEQSCADILPLFRRCWAPLSAATVLTCYLKALIYPCSPRSLLDSWRWPNSCLGPSLRSGLSLFRGSRRRCSGFSSQAPGTRKLSDLHAFVHRCAVRYLPTLGRFMRIRPEWYPIGHIPPSKNWRQRLSPFRVLYLSPNR